MRCLAPARRSRRRPARRAHAHAVAHVSASAARRALAPRASSQARACAAASAAAPHGSGSRRWRWSAPWFGARAVSPSTIAHRASGTSSSSATICASAVRMPVPRSTWPCSAVTLPSSQTASRISGPSAGLAGTAGGWPGAGGGGGGGSRTTSSTPSAARKSRARARRASARRRHVRAPSQRASQRGRARTASQDLDMRAAAAQVARQLVADCALGRAAASRASSADGLHHHAVEAVAALRGLRVARRPAAPDAARRACPGLRAW